MKKSSLFILLTAAAWAAVCFWKVHQAADPSGGDGYFYLKQIEWLADYYRFYHADYSFIFFPLAVIYKITGSSLLAFQVITSFSLFLITGSIGILFFSGLQFIEKHWQRVVLGCFFTFVLAMQGSLLKLSFEFAKSGFAQGLMLLGLVFYFLERKRIGFFFLFLAALTHKIAGIFFILVFCFAFYQWLQKNRRDFKSKRVFWFACGVVGVSLLVGVVVFPRLMKHLTNFFQKISFEKVFLFQAENLLLSRFLIGITLVWLLVGVFQYRRIKDKVFLFLILFSFVPFLPIYSGYNIEIKYRLLLTSFTLSAVVFVRAWPTIRHSYLRRLLMMITLTILSFQSFQYTGFPWIMNWSERIQNLDRLQQRVNPQNEIVTQHGLQFYIDYKTNIRARSMVAPDRKPTYQIAYTPEFYHLNTQLSDAIRQIQILSLGSSYALFEYQDFQNLMKEYPMLSDWRNVFQVRPDFVQDY